MLRPVGRSCAVRTTGILKAENRYVNGIESRTIPKTLLFLCGVDPEETACHWRIRKGSWRSVYSELARVRKWRDNCGSHFKYVNDSFNHVSYQVMRFFLLGNPREHG